MHLTAKNITVFYSFLLLVVTFATEWNAAQIRAVVLVVQFKAITALVN